VPGQKGRLGPRCSLYVLIEPSSEIHPPKWAVHGRSDSSSRRKPGQAKGTSAPPFGSRYGDILPAEGHLFDLLEPEGRCTGLEALVADTAPAQRSSTATRPAEGGNKAAKLKSHSRCPSYRQAGLARDRLRSRRGQLIGQEILEHLRSTRGEVMRVPVQLRRTRKNHPRCIRPGKAKWRIMRASTAAGRCAPTGRSDLQTCHSPAPQPVILGQGAREE